MILGTVQSVVMTDLPILLMKAPSRTFIIIKKLNFVS